MIKLEHSSGVKLNTRLARLEKDAQGLLEAGNDTQFVIKFVQGAFDNIIRDSLVIVETDSKVAFQGLV
jgi:hypothetical protein